MSLDKDGNVIFSTPKRGSNMASFVNNPLDIDFKIEKDKVNKIVPEVISTSFKTPEDFGYATFSFEKIDIMQFLISAFIYNEAITNFELKDAKMVIKVDGNVIYDGNIEAVTNHIMFRDNNYNNYDITVSKSGYKTVVNNYTSEELKSKFNKPIMVILEKVLIPYDGLILHIPFDGDIKDESSKNNTLTNNNVTFTSDRKGNSDGAGSFNGRSSYIDINSVGNFSNLLDEFSLSAWVNVRNTNKMIVISFILPSRQFTIELDGNNGKVRFVPYLGMDKFVWTALKPEDDFELNKWVNIATTWSNTDKKMKIYYRWRTKS